MNRTLNLSVISGAAAMDTASFRGRSLDRNLLNASKYSVQHNNVQSNSEGITKGGARIRDEGFRLPAIGS